MTHKTDDKGKKALKFSQHSSQLDVFQTNDDNITRYSTKSSKIRQFLNIY